MNFHRYVLARYCIETCEATNGTRDDIYIYHVTLRWVETTCQVWCLQPRSANLEFKSFKLSMVRCWNSGSLMICVHSYFTIVSHVFTIPRVQSFLWNGGWTTVSSTLIMPWTCFSHLARKCSSASLYTWSLKTRTAKSPHFKTGWQIKSECSTGIRHISQTDCLAPACTKVLGRFLWKAFCIRRCPLSPTYVAP